MDETKFSKWKINWRKLKTLYRFQIIDESTYDVKFVFELNLLNIITASGIILALFTLLNFLLIAYTPLKQYIPGYGTAESRKEILNLRVKTEEIEAQLKANEKFNNNLKEVLTDKVKVIRQEEAIQQVSIDSNTLINLSTNEKAFINEIENGLRNAMLQENLRTNNKNNVLSYLKISRPVQNDIVADFNPKQNNGIIYLAKKQENCTAARKGTVIVVEQITPNNYIVIVQHQDNLVSKYKNLTQVLIKNGTFVQEGSTIGTIAANEKFTFELWYNGKSINPKKYFN